MTRSRRGGGRARLASILGCLAAIGATPLCACSGPEPGAEEVLWLDEARFEQEVLPMMASRCANPSCHGRPDRALSLYAPMRWRLDPARTHLDEPLTEAELRHDYIASCVFAEARAADGPVLLRKPLGSPYGHYHGGGPVFDGPTDPGYVLLASWVDP